MNENITANESTRADAPTSQLIDWYAVGQGCVIEVGGATVSLRVVGQKGRRTRIAVVAPAPATFSAKEGRD